MQAAQRAVELLPVSTDAVAGATVISHRARVYAEVGEADRAFEALKAGGRFAPRAALRGTETRRTLRSNPRRSALRADPGFARSQIERALTEEHRRLPKPAEGELATSQRGARGLQTFFATRRKFRGGMGNGLILMNHSIPATHVSAFTSFAAAISKATRKAALSLFSVAVLLRPARRRCGGNPRSTVSIRTPMAPRFTWSSFNQMARFSSVALSRASWVWRAMALPA